MLITVNSYLNINPNIIKTVKWLNSLGFQTCDSGDGETHDFECDLDIPYIHIQAKPEDLFKETLRLKGELIKIGIEVFPMNEEDNIPYIISSWNPSEEYAFISVYNITDKNFK